MSKEKKLTSGVPLPPGHKGFNFTKNPGMIVASGGWSVPSSQLYTPIKWDDDNSDGDFDHIALMALWANMVASSPYKRVLVLSPSWSATNLFTDGDESLIANTFEHNPIVANDIYTDFWRFENGSSVRVVEYNSSDVRELLSSHRPHAIGFMAEGRGEKAEYTLIREEIPYRLTHKPLIFTTTMRKRRK